MATAEALSPPSRWHHHAVRTSLLVTATLALVWAGYLFQPDLPRYLSMIPLVQIHPQAKEMAGEMLGLILANPLTYVNTLLMVSCLLSISFALMPGPMTRLFVAGQIAATVLTASVFVTTVLVAWLGIPESLEEWLDGPVPLPELSVAAVGLTGNLLLLATAWWDHWTHATRPTSSASPASPGGIPQAHDL